MKKYGSTYGGWFLEPSLVPEKSVVISAGVGEDVSFDFELQREKNVKIVAIDPTEKAARFLEQQEELKFDFYPVALWGTREQIKIYKNKTIGYASESVLPSHHSVSGDAYETGTITVHELLDLYENISVLKMDIEGSEYSVIEALPNIKIPQVCIEFHDFCTNKTRKETMQCISKLKSMGYIVAHNRNFREITFIHEDA